MPTPQPVHLSETDHARLSVFVHRGKANVRTLKRAQVLLKVDAGWTSAAIANALLAATHDFFARYNQQPNAVLSIIGSHAAQRI
jgi:hypothetical protein